MLLSQLIRSIWPVPPSESELNPPDVFEKYEKSLNAIRAWQGPADSSIIAELSRELFDQTEDRRDHIDRRANSIVTISGISLALLGGLSKLLGDASSNLSPWVLVAVLVGGFLTLTYLLGAMVVAMRVFVRIVRATLDPDDLVPSQDDSDDTYSFRVGVRRIQYTIDNYRANNKAVGFVFAAQRRLQYGLILLVLTASIAIVAEGAKRGGAAADVSADVSSAPVPLTPASPPHSNLPNDPTSVPAIKPNLGPPSSTASPIKE